MKYPRIIICTVILICMSTACVSGCGKKEAEEPVETDFEEYEAYEEEDYEEYEEEEETVEYEEPSEEESEEPSEEPVETVPLTQANDVIEFKTYGGSEDTSSTALIEESYSDLVDCYNSACDRYHSDEVPQNDEIEKTLDQVKSMIDEIGDMDKKTITSDEDQTEMLNYMADISQILQDTMIDMEELVESQTITEDDAEVLNRNFDIMVNNYNNLAYYFNQDGVYMSASQESSMSKAGGWIDDISARGFNVSTRDELIERNNEILDVINLLNAIWDSIG